MKRVCLILVAMALLVCSLAVPVSADEVETDVSDATEYSVEMYATYLTPDLDMYNFSVTRLLSESAGGQIGFLSANVSAFTGILYNAYFTNSCVITSAYAKYLFGYYWDDVGRLRCGRWNNPLSNPNASQFGVFPLGTYELHSSTFAWYTTSAGPLYFSKALAEQQEDFLTSTVFACAWDRVPDGLFMLSVYRKKSSDAVWLDETEFYNIVSNSAINGDLVSNTMDKNVLYPADADSIIWNGVPSGGTSSGSGGSGGSGEGDTTSAPYIYVSTPTTVTKGLYIMPRAELMNPGDISGNILCFLSGHNSAYTKLTESDSVDNMWTLDCGRDETATSLTLTFMVEGRPDIYTTCTVPVVGTQTDNEGSSSDLPGSGNSGDDQGENDAALGEIQEGITSLPGKILDGIAGLFVPDPDSMAAQQEKWTQLLADRFGAVYEAGEIVTEITDVFTLQDTQTEIQFPSVTIPFGEVDWTFGGWVVDVVPDGFEFLIEILKKILDIVCTLAFVNSMKNRFDRVLEERA